jgi:hypothetical protein
MLAPDSKYSGKIIFAGMAHNPSNGNPGIAFVIDTEDGEIEHTLWITGNTVDRVKKTLVELGVKPGDLQKPETLENLNSILQGASCKITTKLGSKGVVEVGWLNGAHGRAPVPPAILAKAAAFFGGPKPPASTGADDFDGFGVSDADLDPPGGY